MNTSFSNAMVALGGVNVTSSRFGRNASSVKSEDAPVCPTCVCGTLSQLTEIIAIGDGDENSARLRNGR
jgi:hypothetical protein